MKALILTIALVLVASVAWGFDATLEWTASVDDAEVRDYEVNWGDASGDYTQSVQVGKDLTYTVTGLTDGNWTYFAVKAIGWNGYESGFSGECATDGVTIPGGQAPGGPGGCFISAVTP